MSDPMPESDDVAGQLHRIDERARKGEIGPAEREVQRAETVGRAGGHPEVSSLEAEISERLAAVDHLYETKQISAGELAEARSRILAAADPTPTTRVSPTRAAGPPPPGSGTGGQGGSPPEPPDKRVAGLPRWAAVAGAAVVVVGIVAIVVVLALVVGGGGDSDEPAADQPTPAEAYAASVQVSLDRLTASAEATSRALGRVSEPAEIAALNAAVERQLEVVESARRRLVALSVEASDRRAHQALLTAVEEQRAYLVQLSRASGDPSQAALTATNRARRAGADALQAYRAFFALVPEAADTITTADLTDTAGLEGAIEDAIEAEAAPTPTPAPAPATSTSTGPSFQSPTGNLRCQVNGPTLFCSSSNDGFGVALPDLGPPSTGSGVASGGVTVPYGSSWSSGVFGCDSAAEGITCRNGSGNGFFLNRDRYEPF